MSSMEEGSHPAISELQMAIQDLITVNIEEDDLDHFGK